MYIGVCIITYIHIYVAFHILFIHSSTNGHIGHFHVLAVVNDATMIMRPMRFYKLLFLPRKFIVALEKVPAFMELMC